MSFSQGFLASWTQNTRVIEGAAQLSTFSDKSFATHVEEGVVWMDFLSIPQFVDVKFQDDETLRQHYLDQTSAVQGVKQLLQDPRASHDARRSSGTVRFCILERTRLVPS